MSDYTPTTEEIKRSATRLGAWAPTAFDAWLAAHDRVVAAQAWDKGVWIAANSDAAALEFQKINPYRTEESN